MGINLGDRVKERISGMKGIVIGKTEWLYGCLRLTIQPEDSKDGKPVESFCVDEPQCELVKVGVIQPQQRTPDAAPVRRHGPREDVKPRASVSR